ncbi:MAG: hypothetical protein U9O65_00950 [Thermotogota bacterium]|nr:hypothetical protein [Thermotogota bacterium]
MTDQKNITAVKNNQLTSTNYPSTLTNDSKQEEELSSQEKKEKKKSKFKRQWQYFIGFVKILFSWKVLRIMLSHHPICEPYEKHVYKIGKLRFCRGCLLSYPPAYASIIIYIFWPQARDFLTTKGFYIQNLWWFLIAFAILAIGGRLLARFSIIIKDASKFGRGALAGFLILVIISQHWAFKISALCLLLAGLTYLSIHRGQDMERICNECEWHAQYEICPGWRDIASELDKLNNLLYDSKTGESNQPANELKQKGNTGTNEGMQEQTID